MDGAQKLKLALDETRMLILGAQVLLGFQLRGALEQLFEALPTAGQSTVSAPSPIRERP
jgi:hypothetical protein